MSTWVGEGRAESGGSAPQLRCYIEGHALAAAYAGTGAMTHLHAKKPDNVRVIQPGERSHLLAGRVHHDRRRDLDGNACETAPEHRQLRQRQLARAVSACTQRKAPQTTKIVAERVASTHILRSARAVPDALHRGRQSLRACHMQPNRRNHERLHRLTEGRHRTPSQCRQSGTGRLA